MTSIFKDRLRHITGGDVALWSIIIFLMLFSILVVFSSTGSLAYDKNNGETTSYLVEQIIYVGISFLAMYIVHLIDYHFYRRHGMKIFYVAVAMMVATFIFGVEINGEKRWLSIMGITFQPSDTLKIALVIVLSLQLSSRQKSIDKIRILPSLSYYNWKTHPVRNVNILIRNTVPIIGPIAISALLVVITNLSTAMIICLAAFIMLYIGRVRIGELLKLMFVTFAVFLLVVFTLKALGVGRADTWVSRMTTHFQTNSDEDNTEDTAVQFQQEQARITIASGWIMGKGPGQSTQRSNLPHPYSDYAYAFIVEEYGIFGGMLILFAYIWIFYRAISIFMRSDNSFPIFLVLGLSLIITIQAFIHIGVSVTLFPVTGQTLPIISKGGSSLLFTSIMFGMILGVSRQIDEDKEAKEKEITRKILLDDWQQILIEENIGIDENGKQVVISKLFKDDKVEFNSAGVIWKNKDEIKDNS